MLPAYGEPDVFLADRDMTDTPSIICVPYKELEPYAKWAYYGAKILTELRSKIPKA